MRRLRIEFDGAVQGVGFRPHVYRLATDGGLSGWVLNDARGVALEVEGEAPAVAAFRGRLFADLPPRAVVESVRQEEVAPTGETGFAIRGSREGGEKSVAVLPDVATCGVCLSEVRDPGNRRHGYPFTNCTNCGPRFTIVRALPYDRPNTTMAGFALCDACRREYDDPRDRRFHAQPNACGACGPRLALWDGNGAALAGGAPALELSCEALAAGATLAVKGLGGFHLMCDARDEAVVARLRERKRREEKPFALMVRDVQAAQGLCEVSREAEHLLESPERPIVLLPKRPGALVADGVAPKNPTLGVMLPATPLHHLLLDRLPIPLVATSGNLKDEPICTDETEALSRLGGLADLFLVHDRPIERHVDDSVVRIVAGVPRVLRRARGYAPLPVSLSGHAPPLLAVGAHLKSTVALAAGTRVVLSQHLGDLETPEALAAFERVIADFRTLWEAAPIAVAHDLHPDYLSTKWAKESGLPTIGVQHHHAHLAACLAENGARAPALGVTWDGTGWGGDGTVWGGEFLLGDAVGFERVAHLRPFRLPGGEAAVREPRRSAAGLLWEMGKEGGRERLFEGESGKTGRSFSEAERAVIVSMLASNVNSPVTTSAGRLFDAVASLLGVAQRSTFEGQAAMRLEWTADPAETTAWPLPVVDGTDAGGKPRAVVDWAPLVEALLLDLELGVPVPLLAARFHNALAGAIVEVAGRVGCPRVALTGGCFQNRLLPERAAEGLRAAGFEVLLHRRVPPNDGGIALGQVAVAAARLTHRHREGPGH